VIAAMTRARSISGRNEPELYEWKSSQGFFAAYGGRTSQGVHLHLTQLSKVTCPLPSFRFCPEVTILQSPSLKINSAVTQMAKTVKLLIERRIARQPFILRMWNSSILFGDDRLMSKRIRGIFYDCGLLHILVVSGYQFILLFGLIQLVIRGPFQFAYASGFLHQQHFRKIVSLADLSSIFCGWILLQVVELATSAQRAFSFILARFMGTAIKQFAPVQKLVLAMGMQLLLFRDHAFSVSSLLSWFIFILIQQAPRQFWLSEASLFALVSMQLMIYVISGQMNACGLIINVLSAPVSLIATLLAIVGMLEIQTLNPWLEHGIAELVSLLLYAHNCVHEHLPPNLRLPDLKFVRATCLGMISLTAIAMTFRSSKENGYGG